MSLMISAARRAMLRTRISSSSSSRLFVRALSTKSRDVPHITQADQVSPKLQMISGYMEHLDRVEEKTDKIRASLHQLKKEHEEKNKNATVKWMDASEIDRFFVRTEEQQQAVEQELSELRQMMQDAKRTFAVDAPDGETDWHMKEEMEEINHIIDDQAVLEDAATVEKQHQKQAAEQREAAKIFAVDAPDGDVDDDIHMKEELEEINHIIEDQAVLEDIAAVERQHQVEAEDAREAAKIFAVDAPDGDVDDEIHTKEELAEINHIIEDQSKLEDAVAVERQHQMEAEDAREAAKIFAVDAPDGDVDDEIHTKEELAEINHIIEDQAKLEDAVAVEKRHQKEAEDQREAQKIFAVDAPDGRVDGFVKEEIEEVKHIVEDQAYVNKMQWEASIGRGKYSYPEGAGGSRKQ